MVRCFGGKNSCIGCKKEQLLRSFGAEPVLSSTSRVYSYVDKKYMQLRKKARVSNYVYVSM